ncbi:unnamed protein product [Caenorhabditis bovis]|uniref:Tripeptidyl-peptidase 2 n=1 Tax=Caenorhabditis bovis TaxID=2654633 RepID=A0A8S1F2S8_9PELO|nr:unnamed protein product [Caenorhabditis bovis]
MTTTPPQETLITQPLDSYFLNKQETEQESFLAKYPTYDGRGILIAILDTGVTTTGERKMVDVIDCSGAGDVDTSTVRSVKDGCIEGLTGRSLKIPETFKCPTGKYHVGVKPIYELYTVGLKGRVAGEKKNDDFVPSHNLAIADALKCLTEHEKEVGGSSEKIQDKWAREEHASKIDFLKSVANETDVGPVADVITWHDGDIWRVCVDTSFRGRLNLCKVLGPFRETGDYAYLTDKDSLVYTVRVSVDGNVTEIAVPCGAHGSHVAGIAAANYPNNPQKNGLAPGARIVSLIIGDHRLGSMETGQAMTRAFNYCAELGVDVINMSYGEGVHFEDAGRVIEEARRLVDRRKVIYVSSAGNSGPALSTVGAPGSTTTGIIGVGAYLTAETADTLYGVFHPCESNIYPWSSRGPRLDGALGVSICAPAAAYANVPQYCRQSMQMMNGTSMSSPNAAGNVACLLSGLRQEGLDWTPFTVKLALENSAKKLHNSEPFSMGQGMLKLNSAFNYITEVLKKKIFPEKLTHFEIKCNHWNKVSKGIYIREPNLHEPQEYSVTIEPIFLNHQTSDNQHSITFEQQYILRCEEPWVSHPETFFAVSQSSVIAVTVDASAARKSLNYAEIVAIDAANPHIGPVFRIPITLIIPEKVDDPLKGYSSQLIGKSGVPERRFVAIPEYATSAKITILADNSDQLDKFVLHTVFLEDEKSARNTECNKFFMPVAKKFSKCIPVKGGKTLETVVVRQWNRGEKAIDATLKIEFFGIQRPSSLVLQHGSMCEAFRMTASPISSIKINPTITFSSVANTLKPQSAKIEPLGPRDVFLTSGMQIHRAFLTYKLSVQKPCEVSLELPGLSSYLYESPVDCILLQIFGQNKSFIGMTSSFTGRKKHMLSKGDYIIQAQIRHPDEQMLEKFKDLQLIVHSKLASKITLSVSRSAKGAISGDDAKWDGYGLLPRQELTLYVGSLADDKLPKHITLTNGTSLRGSFSPFKDTEIAEVDKTPVFYHIAEFNPKPSKGLSMVTTKKEKTEGMELMEAVRDLEVQWVGKLKNEKDAELLFTNTIAKHPDHLPLICARMKQTMQNKLEDVTETFAAQTIRMADRILEITKPAEVLQFMSMKQEHADDLLTVEKWIALTGADESQRKEVTATIGQFEERKNSIIFALQTLASFELDLKLRKSKENIPMNIRYGALTPIIFGCKSPLNMKKKSESFEKLKAHAEKIDAVVEETLKEVDPKWTGNQFYIKLLAWLAADDTKAAVVSAKHAAALGHFGRCAKLLNKVSDEAKAGGSDTKVLDATLAELCDELGWTHLSSHFRNVMLVKNPPNFRPF